MFPCLTLQCKVGRPWIKLNITFSIRFSTINCGRSPWDPAHVTEKVVISLQRLWWSPESWERLSKKKKLPSYTMALCRSPQTCLPRCEFLFPFLYFVWTNGQVNNGECDRKKRKLQRSKWSEEYNCFRRQIGYLYTKKHLSPQKNSLTTYLPLVQYKYYFLLL